MPEYKNIDGIFHQSVKIPEYYYDKHNNLKVSYIQRIVQDTSSLHLDSVGWGYERLVKSGYVYLLAYSKIRVFKNIKVWDTLDVYVWPKSDKGARSYRDIIMKNNKGKTIAEISTVWVLADAINHKIVSPASTPISLIKVDDKPLSIGDARKIKMPAELKETGKRLVTYTDLDANDHMNNCIYSDVFMDYAAKGVKEAGFYEESDFFDRYILDEFEINYRKETFLNDVIKVHSTVKKKDENIFVYLRGIVEDKNSFDCVGLFKPK